MSCLTPPEVTLALPYLVIEWARQVPDVIGNAAVSSDAGAQLVNGCKKAFYGSKTYGRITALTQKPNNCKNTMCPTELDTT